ncbi:MAG TPA: SelB C-terminal domain-containing protein, partial [Acidobacteriota bacterium]
VSNISGEGLDALKLELEDLARESTPRATLKLARLPIDRVFTIHGFGTVVTGTLYSGLLRRDQTVEIVPGPILTKIRGLQSYGSKVDFASEGQRTALNLQGVDKGLLSRGMTLTLPGAMRPTQCLDASLFLVQQAETPLKKRDVVRLHLGTQETLARVLLLQTDLLRQGQSALAQLRTQRPVCAWMGDRFIVRRVSPASTIGGGEILNPAARKRKKKTQEGGLAQVLLNLKDTDRVGAWVGAHRYASEQTLVSLSGYPADHLLQHLSAQPGLVLLGASPRFYCSQDFLQGLSRRLLQMVENFHKANPLAPGMRKEEVRTKLPSALPAEIFQHLLDTLREQEKLEINAEFVSISGKTALLSPEDQRHFDRLEQVLRESGSQPPAIKELLQKVGIDDKRGRNLLFLLQQRNLIVKIGEDFLVHRAHLDQVRQRLKENFPPGSQFNVGQFKDLLGITRKHAIPLLEYLDRQRVTRRVGDSREVLK